MKQLLVLIALAFSTLSNAQPSVPMEPDLAVANAAESPKILVLVRQATAHHRGGVAYSTGYNSPRSRASREVTGKRLAKEHGVKFVGFWPMPEIGLDCLILEAIDGQDVKAVIAKIEQDRQVEWAEPAAAYGALGAANYNDPLFAATPAATQWHLAELHKSASGKGVTIAIVDSGIDASHPDLSGQLQFNRNFVEGRPLSAEQHGTGIAGIIAAKANNRQGMVGVAPGARLLGLRACWQRTNHSLCDSLSLAKALHFAIKKDADIINLSLAGPPSKLLNALVAKMVANGSVVVAAVDPTNQGDVFPSSSKGVVSVTDEKSVMLTKNQYRAPGSYVPTTQLNSKWFMVHGTSYSAAHVSGLYALMIEKRGSSSRPLTLIREEDGSGKIDTRASLKSAAGR